MARIAILLCTHNGGAFVTQLLQSLAAQTLAPAALFVHDWNSDDGTFELVQRFASDHRAAMHVEVQRHAEAPGACRSFIAGLRACLRSGAEFDHLALCDQDDLWAPDKLARYAQLIDGATPALGLVYGDVRLVDPGGREIAPSYYGARASFRPPLDLRDPGLLLANPVVGMTISISRACLSDCAGALDGPWLMHDWALVLLAVGRGHRTAYLATPLVGYRQHANNVVGAKRGLRLRQRLDKASGHFGRVRRQAEWFGAVAAAGLGPGAAKLVRSGPMQRFHFARAALMSNLLRRRSRWLLAGAVLTLW